MTRTGFIPRLLLFVAVSLLAPLIATGCHARKEKIIATDGSSTVQPVTEVAAEEFQRANPGIKVLVGTSGTGGGFKKFVRGELDISNASRPISKREMDEAKEHGIEYMELPVCFDALTVVVNPENDFVDYLTVEELNKIWRKDTTVTLWSEVRDGWPEKKISLYGPGTDSGTFDYFTEAINGKAGNSRADYTASEDDNVLVNGVAKDKFALAYFGFAYYAPNSDKLKPVPVQWSKGKIKTPVVPSSQGIRKGTYAPLSRPLFIYVNKKSAVEREEVRQFVNFYLYNAAALSRRKKYVPLSGAAYKLVRERFAELKTGSAFGGKPEVGVAIEDLLRRELK